MTTEPPADEKKVRLFVPMQHIDGVGTCTVTLAEYRQAERNRRGAAEITE